MLYHIPADATHLVISIGAIHETAKSLEEAKAKARAAFDSGHDAVICAIVERMERDYDSR